MGGRASGDDAENAARRPEIRRIALARLLSLHTGGRYIPRVAGLQSAHRDQSEMARSDWFLHTTRRRARAAGKSRRPDGYCQRGR